MNPLEHYSVTFSGVHLGEEGSVDSIVDRLSRMRTADVIQTTSKLMMFMEAVEGGGIRNVQASLAEALFPREVSHRLLKLLEVPAANGGVDVLFFPQQLMSLQKLALAVGEQGVPTSFGGGSQWGEFLLAAAQVSDVIQEKSAFPGSEVTGADREDSLAVFFLRNAEANRLAFYKAVAGRAYRYWIGTGLPWPDGLEHPDDYCRRSFGVSMRRFMAICLAPAYARVNMVEPSPSEAVFDPVAYFARAGIEEREVCAVIDPLTYPSRLPSSVADEAATYWAFADLAAQPYLTSSETTLVPCSVTRAFERGTTGLFWLLHASLGGQGEAINLLTSHFGQLFEQYCLDVASLSAPSAVHVEGEIEYRRTGRRDLVKSSDVLVSGLGTRDASRVFVECAAIRPTQPLFRDAERSAFANYVAKLVGKLQQLDRSINDHRLGDFELTRDVAGPNDAYLPVLVVDEPFQWTVHLRNVLERETTGLGLFSPINVTKPIVCDVGEYEHLWHAVESGRSVVELLSGYLAETDRTVPLEQYLYSTTGGLGSPASVSLGFDAFSELLIEELQLSG
jgi:hypothetical protein